MNGFEVYKTYLALTRHFDTDTYDFFKYSGKVKCSVAAYDKRTDRRHFVKISHNRDPLTFLVGNMLFNPDNWIGLYADRFQLQFEKFLTNGPYLFRQELSQLRDSFNQNFNVDQENPIPYVLKLFRNDKISFHTVCVFETLLHCNDRWSLSPQFLIFDKLSKKICKAAPFFKIETDKYRRILLDHFETVS